MTLKTLATAADIFGYTYEIDGDTMQARVFIGDLYSHTVEIR